MKAPPAHFGGEFTKTIHQDPDEAIDPSKVTLPDGFVVVVTGAGKGIGEYIAKAYAQARASNIVITARTKSDLDRVKLALEEIASKSGRATKVSIVAGDASKEEHFRQIKHVLETQHGSRLDCLINNAGTLGSNQGFTDKITETASEDVELITGLNYLGPYYSMKQLIPLMLEPQSVVKTIINLSSVAGHATSGPPIAYSISKVAVNRLSQHVGETYAGEGLVCLALHPGGVMSDAGHKAPEFLKPSKPVRRAIELCDADTFYNSADRQHYAVWRGVRLAVEANAAMGFWALDRCDVGYGRAGGRPGRDRCGRQAQVPYGHIDAAREYFVASIAGRLVSTPLSCGESNG